MVGPIVATICAAMLLISTFTFGRIYEQSKFNADQVDAISDILIHAAQGCGEKKEAEDIYIPEEKI